METQLETAKISIKTAKFSLFYQTRINPQVVSFGVNGNYQYQLPLHMVPELYPCSVQITPEKRIYHRNVATCASWRH